MVIATYLPVFLMIGVATLLATVFFIGHNVFGKKAKFSEERMQPYESGSPSDGGKFVKLSVKFYLTAILFVVFDIEVVFVYPWAIHFKELGWMGLLSMFGFLGVIVVALVYVWRKGALEWDS
jgi:NADH-quinone oxidoreductase subunit A